MARFRVELELEVGTDPEHWDWNDLIVTEPDEVIRVIEVERLD